MFLRARAPLLLGTGSNKQHLLGDPDLLCYIITAASDTSMSQHQLLTEGKELPLISVTFCSGVI